MKKYARFGGVSKSYICPVCEKLFLVPFQSKGGGKTQWVYKRKKAGKIEYICSYHCFKTEGVKVNDGNDS